MMEFNGIQQVQQRISEIQKRFGIVQPPIPNGQSFQQELNSELQKVSKEPAAAGSGREAARQQAGSMPGTAAVAVSVPAAQPTDDESLMIQSAATKYGVDPKLVSAVAEAESGGNQSAVSDAGAIGVMQLMPETAAALGVNPYDEQQNIELQDIMFVQLEFAAVSRRQSDIRLEICKFKNEYMGHISKVPG